MKLKRKAGAVAPADKKNKNAFGSFMGDAADAGHWMLRGCVRLAGILTIILFDVGFTLLMTLGGVPAAVVTLSNLLGVGYESPAIDLVFVFGMPMLFIVGMCLMFSRWFLMATNGKLRGFFSRWAAGIGRNSDDTGVSD